MKNNLASKIRAYMAEHPTAKAPEVVAATGATLAYVYSVAQKARKAKTKTKAKAVTPTKGQEVIRDVISEDQNEINRLRNMLGDQLLLIDMQEDEIKRLGIIIQYLEKFLLTAERVEEF